jgi:formate-dependent nitrite reductase cytochrome c552 subunit
VATATTRKRRGLWLFWTTFTLGLVAWLSYNMLDADDKQLFMPGPLTSGHHQIGIACDTCHTDPLGGSDVMQQACIDCHGQDRKKPFDSHPRSKFQDPRNADRLEHIDALLCTSCHVEHQPEITASNGVTQPGDFCFYCHAQIGEDRPSHQGMAFDTCNAAGCHNFHNNRALYTDFLVKHLHEPDLLEQPLLPAREFASVLEDIADYPVDRYPLRPLAADDADAPADSQLAPAEHGDWLSTAHARSGVNCSACHLVTGKDADRPAWSDHPDHRACSQCHALEVARFERGKHGMRLAVGLAPMTPAQARLPMKADAAQQQLVCNSCHPAHRFDTRNAAVDACLGCHDDAHSLAYKQSGHFQLWQKELSGAGEPGSGVSCASCHMPRIDFDVNDWMSRIMVDHNQNATLSPNEKMIRPACMHCHGLGFTLDALADPTLIASNFQGLPAVHVKSMDMAEADQKRAAEETAGLQDNPAF